MIYDERVHEIGLMMPNYATAVSSGVIKREAALRDLAEQLGVNREGLESTIALVNALAFEDATPTNSAANERLRCCSAPTTVYP